MLTDSKDSCLLPRSNLDIHSMIEFGSYHEDFRIDYEESLFSSVKLNVVFGEAYSKDYYMFTLNEKFGRTVGLHRITSVVSLVICKGGVLIINPTCTPEHVLIMVPSVNLRCNAGIVAVDGIAGRPGILDIAPQGISGIHGSRYIHIRLILTGCRYSGDALPPSITRSIDTE
jgi:hypothetical protein